MTANARQPSPLPLRRRVPCHPLSLAGISSEQVAAVRKRWIIERFRKGEMRGTLWAINTDFQDYGLPDAHGYDQDTRNLLSEVRTDLNCFTEGEMSCLENHGYSLADAVMRSFGRKVYLILSAPFQFPHPKYCDTDVCKLHLAASASRRPFRDICQYLANRTNEDWLQPVDHFFQRSAYSAHKSTDHTRI